MGIVRHLLERRASLENPTTPMNPAAWLLNWAGGARTKAGVRINEKSALAVSTVYACVRILAEGVAGLPLVTYRRNGRSRTPARDHWAYRLLHDAPNPWQTSFIFRETLMGHVALWGNCYAELVPNGRRPVALMPLRPDWTEPVESNGRLFYRYREKGDPTNARMIAASDMLHVPGLGFDGVKGYSPVSLMRDSIGLSKAMENFGSDLFSNGATPSGVLTYPGKITGDMGKNIRDSFEAKNSQNRGTMVLEEGLAWTQVGIPPEDSQFLQSRTFQVAEIARPFRMQLHKLQEMTRATFSNIEQQAIEHVQDTLRPWMVRFEQEYNRKLFIGEDQGTVYAEHKIDALLRGDAAARHAAYAVGRQWGYYSADDVREFENLNPLPDKQGEIYLVPMNMVPADEAGRPALPPAAPPAAPDDDEPTRSLPERRKAIEARSLGVRRRLQRSFVRLFEAPATKITRREVEQTRKAVKRHLGTRGVDDLREWAEEFYEAHKETVSRAMLPVLVAYAEQVSAMAVEEVGADSADLDAAVRAYAASFAARHVGSKLGQLLQLMDDTDVAELGDAINQRLDEWSERSPAKIADRESKQAGSAFAKAAWVAVGVTLLRWVAFGDTCPICTELDGQVVGVERNFVSQGDTVAAESNAPLKAQHNFGHPPLHVGCDCMISPG